MLIGMVYLSHQRLMRESFGSIRHHAMHGAGAARRACAQLVDQPPVFRQWSTIQNRLMRRIAVRREREPQILELRLIATELIARAARVRQLQVAGLPAAMRAELLRAAWPGLTTPAAMLAEHRHYVRAVASLLCVGELLAMINDSRGLTLIGEFEAAYQQLFGLRCDWMLASAAMATDDPAARLLAAKTRVARLRQNLLDGVGMPPVRVLLPAPAARLPVAEEPFDRHARVAVG